MPGQEVDRNPMVRRRSTVRFRNGAPDPDRDSFSNNSDDRRGTSRGRRSPTPVAPIALQRPGGVLRGAARGHSTAAPITAAPSGRGTGQSQRERSRSGIGLMARFTDARSHPMQPAPAIALLVGVRQEVLRPFSAVVQLAQCAVVLAGGPRAQSTASRLTGTGGLWARLCLPRR
jgi:hypothetical protein